MPTSGDYRETINVTGDAPAFRLRQTARDVGAPGGLPLPGGGGGGAGAGMVYLPGIGWVPADLLNTPGYSVGPNGELIGPDGQPVGIGEGTTVTGEMPPPPPPAPTYPDIPIPMPPPTAPPPNGPPGPPPEEPLAGPVDEGIPPFLFPEPILNFLKDLPGFEPTGVPKGEGGIPDWLQKLLKGLLLAGALIPPGGEGGGGGGTRGGGVTGGGASGGTPGLGTLGYRGMQGGGNYQPWNPGRGQQLLRSGGGGGGGGPQETGAMLATLFGAGRK